MAVEAPKRPIKNTQDGRVVALEAEHPTILRSQDGRRTVVLGEFVPRVDVKHPRLTIKDLHLSSLQTGTRGKRGGIENGNSNESCPNASCPDSACNVKETDQQAHTCYGKTCVANPDSCVPGCL